jgi:hypothetical protein
MSFPEDEDAATEEELAAATALASRVDSLLDGEPLPGLMDADEKDLAELSSMIHSAHHEMPLATDRQASIIEAALAQGAGVGNGDDDGENDLARARAKRTPRWPIVVGGLVMAAAIALLVLRPPPKSEPQTSAPVARVMDLPASQQSRPGDALVGQIAREASAEAATRLDQLYGDRMTGYRALQYRKLVGER